MGEYPIDDALDARESGEPQAFCIRRMIIAPVRSEIARASSTRQAMVFADAPRPAPCGRESEELASEEDGCVPGAAGLDGLAREARRSFVVADRQRQLGQCEIDWRDNRDRKMGYASGILANSSGRHRGPRRRLEASRRPLRNTPSW